MTTKSVFCACACYFTDQIFLQNLRLHVRYLGKAEFLSDYGALLRSRHGLTDDSVDELIQEIEAEVSRRKSRDMDSLSRRTLISSGYSHLHPDLRELKESFLTPEFLQLVKFSKSAEYNRSDLMNLLTSEKGDQVYSFPVFTEDFCVRFIEELRRFEETDLPKGRPNTMNRSGYLLDELGFYDQFVSPLRENYLQCVCEHLYPDWVGQGLDSHKAFVVRYHADGENSLSYHYDNAEVTINICLGDRFTEGGLYLGPMRTDTNPNPRFTEYRHVIGRGVLHRGQQMHGAEPITDGERYNMIIWMRASSVRNRLCPMCNETPKLVEAQDFGDGFTKPECNNSWCSSS